jgi:hypothetical protein
LPSLFPSQLSKFSFYFKPFPLPRNSSTTPSSSNPHSLVICSFSLK